MTGLADAVRATTEEHGFSGVVRIDRGGRTEVAVAAGLADRAHGIANTVDTRFGIASGSKGLTALIVLSLVADGALALDTSARSLIDGDELPGLDPAVTIEHLLSHRSGIGDHIDEDDESLRVTDHVLALPVHVLDRPEAYLPILATLPPMGRPGEAFSYCNAGFVLLSLLAERAGGADHATLLRTRVCEPAGLEGTELLRTDSLPGDVALGYLEADGLRTNVLHLPVVPGGDGGATTSVDDVHRLWDAFVGGRIIPAALVAEAVRPRSDTPHGDRRYGLGFWLDPTGPGIELEGYDAGASFRSVHDPAAGTTWTVASNTSEGAWPVARRVAELLAG